MFEQGGSMQRILHVIGRMDRAGAETLIMNLYRNIDRSRYQFDFMVFTKTKADYDDEIEELGGRIYHMPAFNGINYPYLAYLINKFFDEHSYSVVHGHIGSLAPMYLAIAKKHGSYTIAHSHSTNSSSFLYRTTFTILAWSVRYIADYFFACSEEAGIDRFGMKIVNSDHFKIINNGIDSDLYRYSAERHEKMKEQFSLTDKIVFGHVGRFALAKNHPFLIDVFNEIHKQIPDSVLVLAGRGPDEDKIKKQVTDLDLNESVYFLGIRNDVPDLMNLFDCFIFPSFTEGLGIVGIEAQAAGLPCFMSEGIPEEAVITDHAWRMNLEDGSKKWADEICSKIADYKRNDSTEKVKKAGYDIKSIAVELQLFYSEYFGRNK